MDKFILADVVKPAKIRRKGKSDAVLLSLTADGLVSTESAVLKNNTELYKLVSKGQLVTGIHMSEGSAYILKDYDEGAVSPAYSIWDIDDEKIVPDYFEAALHSEYSQRYFSQHSVNIFDRNGKVPTESLINLPLPSASLNEQLETMRIISTIDRCKHLLEKMERNNKELIESHYHRFISEYSFSTVKLTDIATIQGGQSVSKEVDGVNIMPMCQGVSDFGTFQPSPSASVSDASCIAAPGDTLISVRHGNNNVNIVDTKCAIGRSLSKATPISKMSDSGFLFLSLLMNDFPTGSGIIKTITKKHFSKMEIPYIDVKYQKKLSSILSVIINVQKRIDELKKRNDMLKKSVFNDKFNISIQQ